MRVIDADLLKKNCKCTGKFEDNFKCVSLSELTRVIDKQPTVFSKNKILLSLYDELRSTSKEIQECHNKNILHFDYTRGYADGIAKAIEIVKGVEE